MVSGPVRRKRLTTTSWAVDVTADARQDEDHGGKGVGGADTVLGGERAQDLELEFAETDLRR